MDWMAEIFFRAAAGDKVPVALPFHYPGLGLSRSEQLTLLMSLVENFGFSPKEER